MASGMRERRWSDLLILRSHVQVRTSSASSVDPPASKAASRAGMSPALAAA